METVLERSIAVGLANHTILVSRNGREFPIDVCAAPINDDQGGLTGAVLVFRDVTESRRIDEQLRHAQKMEAVGQLAGGVAHDFNNMLTVILNYTHLLMNAEKENPWNNYLNEIRLAGERSADLTRQLLTFCRKRLAEPNAQDLNEVIRQTEQMLHRLIGENIELETRLEPGLGTVLADSGVLEQVLINLAVNARDAISEQGKIVIETSNVVVDQTMLPSLSCGVYRVLRVIDNGQGIPPELIAPIFDPFFTTKELGKGTGLGLSTAYGIVQQCRGHIDVESTVGKGTTFTVYLPPAPQATIQDSAFSELELPKGTETVLLVEDEQSVRNLATHILSLCGYKVFAAENGTIAVQIASEHPGKIDIVVSDVVMPLMGAKIMLQLLKEHLPNLRVLLLSGHDLHGVVDDRGGIDKVNFLSKPFTLGEFTRSVRQTLDDLPVYLNARF